QTGPIVGRRGRSSALLFLQLPIADQENEDINKGILKKKQLPSRNQGLSQIYLESHLNHSNFLNSSTIHDIRSTY
ncbi:hypothetical protein LSAT2_013836, partial [Lamellibrachia satsuma]